MPRRRRGFLHIGGARTALFNWLYTRRHGGTFVLRIEDTDQARSTEESTQAILDAMTWLGLNWDEGPYFQAERVNLHREMVQKLIDEGKAYCCTCSRRSWRQSGKMPSPRGANRSMTAPAAKGGWPDQRKPS